jgi:methionyl aminopeptidase
VVEYKTPGEIDAMHAAGQVVARILAAVRDQAVPGARLAELDATARDVLAEDRATSPFPGYQPTPVQSPFPAVICASVNDAALHDIPGRYRLKDGDLLSIDCGATLDGWAADAAISVSEAVIDRRTQALAAQLIHSLTDIKDGPTGYAA